MLTRSDSFARRLLVAAAAFVLAGTGVAQDQGAPTMGRAADLARNNQWREAAEVLEHIVRDNPEHETAWFELGYALHMDRQYERALYAHRKAAEFPGQKPTATYNVACALALLGRTDDAFEALRAAIDAGFDDRGLTQRDTDLASLRKDPRWSTIWQRPDDPRRELDFWLGAWEVTNAAGQSMGTSRITLRQNGNIIHERWESARGSGGESINYYDPAERKWKQVWVDARGGVVRYEGGMQDGALRFTGVYIEPDGTTRRARAVLEPSDDGRIRHKIEHSADGETWTIFFEGTYRRTGTTAAAEAAPEQD